jgi:ribonucleoside-diphosphate reductase alpha chain
MHLKKFPSLKEEIEKAYEYVYEKKVLPSMRALQFSGKPIEINNARLYNCFGRDTKFFTNKGVRSFEDFQEGSCTVVLTHEGNWRKAIVRKYGKQKVNKVTFRYGKEGKKLFYFTVTPNHRWILQKAKDSPLEVSTTKLEVGHKVLASPYLIQDFDFFKVNPLAKLYWVYGFFTGKNLYHKYFYENNNSEEKNIYLTEEEVNLYKDRFDCLGFLSLQNKDGEKGYAIGDCVFDILPDFSWDNPELLRAFTIGLKVAYGFFVKEFNLDFNQFLFSLPLPPYLTPLKELTPLIGIIEGEKKEKEEDIYFEVVSIEEKGEEEVWCLEVEDDRSFVLFPGICTGNCSYLPLDHPDAFSEAFFLLLSGCFKEGTLIKTKEGPKPIEKITIFDRVLTFNTETKKYYWVNPLWAGETPTKKIPKLGVEFEDGSYIQCTIDHPFYTQNRGWVEAEELTKEDIIENFDEPLRIVKKYPVKDAVNYFDITIEDTHTFVLGNGCVVHNTGVGYSVQKHHINKLAPVMGILSSQKKKKYLIGDSIEGWADACKVLVESYFYGKREIDFDFRDIRPKGERLITSGGKAPGPEPLRIALVKIQSVFENALSERGRGTNLTTLEAHDIMCHIADAVLSGGIRRAAMISLFSFDDPLMIGAKANLWWEQNPQRARANNSVVAVRSKIKKKDFFNLWEKIKESGAGEPGVFFTHDYTGSWGINPCAEVSLQPFQFCNLCEINAGNVKDQEDLNNRAAAASFIGTLQASYTDFHYLRPIWRDTTEQEALIGVGMTGIGSGEVLDLDLKQAAEIVKSTIEEIAKKIGINYIRRIRVGKEESIYSYLKNKIPDLLEDDLFNPNIAILSIPQKAPQKAIFRSESPLQTLERVKKFNLEWIMGGHREGANTNNVSCTINIKDHEWEEVRDWMWENRNYYTAISVMPYDGGIYKQAPFQTTTEEQYHKLMKKLKEIDLTQIIEKEDKTSFGSEIACGGGACELDLPPTSIKKTFLSFPEIGGN